MVSREAEENSELGISPTLLFYVAGFALAFEFLVIGFVGLAA